MKLFLASVVFAAASMAQAKSITPNLEFPVKNGAASEIYKMAEHPNDVYVFEVFSLSCGYCNENAPFVDKLAADYKSNPRVHVIDTGLDSNDSYYKEWIRRHVPNHVVVADPAARVYNPLKSSDGIPQTFFVNCKGEMVGNLVGGPWDAGYEKKARAYVEAALKTTCQ